MFTRFFDNFSVLQWKLIIILIGVFIKIQTTTKKTPNISKCIAWLNFFFHKTTVCAYLNYDIVSTSEKNSRIEGGRKIVIQLVKSLIIHRLIIFVVKKEQSRPYYQNIYQ